MMHACGVCFVLFFCWTSELSAFASRQFSPNYGPINVRFIHVVLLLMSEAPCIVIVFLSVASRRAAGLILGQGLFSTHGW